MATNPASLNTPYIFLMGVVLIAVVSLFLVIKPMIESANVLKEENAKNTQTLKNKEEFYNSLSVKIEQLSALPEVEKQIAAVLPDTDRTQDTLRVLNEYATQAGLLIASITNNSSTNDARANAARARGDDLTVPSEVRTLAFTVGVSGAYEQVKLFLSLLGKSPRVIDVKEISFNQVGTEPGRITAQLNLQLYSQYTSRTPGT
ncbi:MAG: hypothetical protein O3A36_02475 [bacterium]|nr:hypothetical protein [bacterium]